MTAPFAIGVFCSALIGLIAGRSFPEFALPIVSLCVLAPTLVYVTRRSWRRPDWPWRLALLAGVWAGSFVWLVAIRGRE